MAIEDLFNEYKRVLPSLELKTFRIPGVGTNDNIGRSPLFTLVGRVNASEFRGFAAETMRYEGPEGAGVGLWKVHFFHLPGGWNTHTTPDGQRVPLTHANSGRIPEPVEDFSPLDEMIVPDPEPLWTGSREVNDPLKTGEHVAVVLGRVYRQEEFPTLRALVSNTGDRALDDLGIRLVIENERLQPGELGGVVASIAGGAYGLAPEDDFTGTLAAGRIEPFVLPEAFFDMASRSIFALSPERYWLSVRSGDREIHRVDGREVGGHVDVILADWPS